MSSRSYGWLATLLLSVFLVQSIASMRLLSATQDETTYIPSGYVFLVTGETRLNPEHPPLVKSLCALPLLVLEPRLNLGDPAYTNDPPDQWTFGYRFLFGNDANRILFWGRLPIVLLTAALGIYVFLWARGLFGPGAGLVALFLFAGSPNIIAHSHLATLDAAVATFSVATLYHLWSFSIHGRAGQLIASGVALGLALASKHAAIVLLPVSASLLLLMALFRLPDQSQQEKSSNTATYPRLWRAGLAFLGMVTIAVGLVWLTYGAPGELPVYFERLKPGNLYPDPNPGHEYYLAGAFSGSGWWYYFPVAFLLKTPVPTLLLLALSLLLAGRCRGRHWTDDAFILVPAAAFLMPVIFTAHNIGLRYLLPLYPLIFISVSRVLPFLLATRLRQACAVLLGIWYVIGAALIYPDHLAYFNEIVGGPSRGYEYLDDSNIDWGQDIKRLKAWTDDHDVETIRLMYPWNVSANYYGIRWEDVTKEDLLVKPRPGTYAMSVHMLTRARLWAHRAGVQSDWLDRYTPIDTVGYSLLIYRFES